MNESERETDPQERKEPEQPLGRPGFAVAADEPARRDPRERHAAVGGAGENGRRFDRLTQLLAGRLDRRGVAGVVTGALLTLSLAGDASGKKKKKNKKNRKKKPVGCRNGCPPNHICTGGRCVPACTPGRPCGAECCRNAEVCLNNVQCVVPCNDGRLRCGGVCCGPTEICNAANECDDALSDNLIRNGDAESGSASPNGRTPVVIPDWTGTTGGTTVVAYGNTTGGWPEPDDPGPDDRGVQLFTGGNHGVSEMTQTASVSEFAAPIDGGSIGYELSGFLGGFGGQGDRATLTAIFLDGDGDELDRDSIGPVTTADRNSATGLLFRSATGAVPVGTRSIKFVLTQTRSSGTSNDGYADNLSCVLRVT